MPRAASAIAPNFLKQMQRDLRRQSEDLRAEVAVHAKSDKLS